MYNTIKVLLTIELEGATLVRKSEATEYPWQKTITNPETKKDEVIDEGTYLHKDYARKKACKVIKINLASYLHFRSAESRPDLKSFQKYHDKWYQMTPKEKLEAHFRIICAAERGKSFTYQILPQ